MSVGATTTRASSPEAQAPVTSNTATMPTMPGARARIAAHYALGLLERPEPRAPLGSEGVEHLDPRGSERVAERDDGLLRSRDDRAAEAGFRARLGDASGPRCKSLAVLLGIPCRDRHRVIVEAHEAPWRLPA